MNVNESLVEDATLAWFRELSYTVSHGPHMAPGEPAAERDTFGDVVLPGRLREAIRRLNPTIPEDAREDALRKVLRVGTPSLTQSNRHFHAMLRDGVPVEYQRADGGIAGDQVWLVDFDDARKNDWLAVNQFTVIEGQHNRRPDIVVFVNGLPLAVIELKNAADEDASVQPTADLQAADRQSVSLQRGAGGVRWHECAYRLADSQPGVVQGLAFDRRQGRCAEDRAGTGRAGARGVRAETLSRPASAFHRIRRRCG
jgi:type I restriction enzyme R subunit